MCAAVTLGPGPQRSSTSAVSAAGQRRVPLVQPRKSCQPLAALACWQSRTLPQPAPPPLQPTAPRLLLTPGPSLPCLAAAAGPQRRPAAAHVHRHLAGPARRRQHRVDGAGGGALGVHGEAGGPALALATASWHMVCAGASRAGADDGGRREKSAVSEFGVCQPAVRAHQLLWVSRC